MILRLILSELFGGFLALPVWWYTRGLALVWRWALRTIGEASELFALGVWVRNLFVPMYGETQWSGRLISFFVRLFMIVARALAVAVWSLVAAVSVAAYVAVLPVSLVGVLYHGIGLVLS